MEYNNYISESEAQEIARKSRRRKVAIAAIILLGLSGSAYALNETTREREQKMIYAYSSEDEAVLREIFTDGVVTYKYPESNNNGENQQAKIFTEKLVAEKDVNLVKCLIIEKKGPGIIEKAFNNVVALAKGR
jgi:hypothetical protein